MSELTIKTDHKWRNLLYGYELPAKARKEFDYLSDEEFELHNFISYRKNYYDLGEFMALSVHPKDSPLASWHGYHGDSFFSGVVIRLSENCEQYQIGTYHC